MALHVCLYIYMYLTIRMSPTALVGKVWVQKDQRIAIFKAIEVFFFFFFQCHDTQVPR